MKRLISKVQYRDFETGEFIDEQKRSFGETWSLIEAFPWQQQDKNLEISLTKSSITIEGNNKDYLKFGVYYNGKYALHYFDAAQRLYTKSLTGVADAFPYIKDFFEADAFDPAGFRKENTWPQHPIKHFVSQDFYYALTPASVRKYLWYTNGMFFCLLFFLSVIVLIYGRGPAQHQGREVLIFMAVVLPFGVPSLLLFFNYYLYARNKVLIMSKGADVFYFGNKDNPVRYTKADVVQFTVVRVKSGSSSLSCFVIVTLFLRDGSEIKIPNILVNEIALMQKLSGLHQVLDYRFPLLRE